MDELTIHKDAMVHFLGGFKSQEVEVGMLDQHNLEKMYRTNWLTRNAVDMYAEDMTALGVDWKGDSETSKFLERQFRIFRIWPILTEAIRWARLYGGSIVCIDMVDNQPEKRLNSNGTISGFRVFDRYEVDPDTEILTQGRDAGLPSSYRVNPAIYAKSFNLDSSRAIRFVGSDIPHSMIVSNNLWGDSVVQALKDVLDRYEKSMESSQELLKRSYLRFLGIKGFWKTMVSDDPRGAQAIANTILAINEVQNISGLTVADVEDEFQTQQYAFGGIKDVLNAFAQDVSGATGVPLVRLFGMSPAGFSTGEADLKNYYQSIKRAQEAMLREPIERLAKLFLESAGKNADDIDFQFVSHNEPTQAEKLAATQSAVGTILQVYDANLINASRALEEIRRLSDNSGGLFSSVTEEDVTVLEDPPIPEPDLSGGGNASV